MLTIAQLHEKAALMRQCPTLSEGRANNSFATMGLSFESQVVFGCYILDFVVLSRLLVVEVDGESHAGKQAYDARRDAFCAKLGLQVLRIPNAWAHTAALLVEPYPEIPNYAKRWAKALRKATHRQAVVENLKLLTPAEREAVASAAASAAQARREMRRQSLTAAVQGLPEGCFAKESLRTIAQAGLTPELKQRKKTPENREARIAAGIEKMLAKKASRKAKLEVRLSRKLGNELSAP